MDQLFADGLFDGEVVLITGGGTGIGLVSAMEMGRLGAKIAICGRRPAPLEAAVKELESLGIEAFGAPCDIREPEAIDAYVDTVLERFERIDVLINNAGGQFPTTAESLSPKGFAAVIRNNLVGTWTMTRAVATKAMIPQKRGRIVNVIAQIIRGFPGMVHTGAARAGVDNMTTTLAVEWAVHGIRVNAVAPGFTATEILTSMPDKVLEGMRARTPLGRLGQPEDIARAVVYVADPENTFLTGQTIDLNGGWNRKPMTEPGR